MPEIIVTISPTGESEVEAQGFSGHGCEAATQTIRDRLGGEELSHELKQEWYDEHEHESN